MMKLDKNDLILIKPELYLPSNGFHHHNDFVSELYSIPIIIIR